MPGPLILGSDQPDRDQGLNNLLAGILKWSCNLSAWQAIYDGDINSNPSHQSSDSNSDVETRYPPTNKDYPLLRVCCIVSLNHYNLLIFH